MAYELIVNSNKGEILIALLQDKKLPDLLFQDKYLQLKIDYLIFFM